MVKENLKDKIVTADCLKHMAKLKDGTFDHCITDPPYNISGYDHKKKIGWLESNKTWKEEKNFNKIDEKWDSFSDQEYDLFLQKTISEICRVVKPNGNIVLFGSYHNIYQIGYIFRKMDLRIVNSLIWYKRNAFPNVTQRMFCESTEQMIWAVNNSIKKAKNWTFNYHELKSLTENGKLIFSVFEGVSSDKELNEFLMYSHSAKYIKDLANLLGFQIKYKKTAIHEYHKGNPIPALVYILQK